MAHNTQSNSRHPSAQAANPSTDATAEVTETMVIAAVHAYNDSDGGVLGSMRSALVAALNARPSIEAKAHSLPAMPSCLPRAQAEDLPGYLESDREWMENPNNLAALRWFIDNSDAIRVAIKR